MEEDVGGRSLSVDSFESEPNIPQLSVDRPSRNDRGMIVKLALLRLAVFTVCTQADDAVETRFL